MEVSLRRVQETPSHIRKETNYFSDMGRRIETLFDQVFGTSPLVTYMTPETRGVFYPRTDIKETKKNIKIVSEMPGMDPNDIDVSVHNGILTITGEKKGEKEETGTDYHHIERSYGCFSRSITIPDSVDSEKVESTYKNGVLTVTLPKTEKTVEQSKKIPILSA